MKGIKLLKPQPSPKSYRDPLVNITNCFHSRPKSQKDTYRSPSHSPCTSRVTMFNKDDKKINHNPKTIETKFSPIVSKCVNHKDKLGKFKIENQHSFSYCQSCAIELNQKGKKIVVIKVEDVSVKMVGEAKQYLKACDDVLSRLNSKRGQLKQERFKIDTKFNQISESIQEERANVIAQVNQKYNKQIKQNQQIHNINLIKLDEQLQRIVHFLKDFQTVKKDVIENVKEINIHIDVMEFREIMNIYWNKISTFNEIFAKLPNPVDSHFVSKFVPSHLKTFQETQMTKQPNGKQFTFSKNLWDRTLNTKGKQVLSYEDPSKVSDSGQSIVQQKIWIR